MRFTAQQRELWDALAHKYAVKSKVRARRMEKEFYHYKMPPGCSITDHLVHKHPLRQVILTGPTLIFLLRHLTIDILFGPLCVICQPFNSTMGRVGDQRC